VQQDGGLSERFVLPFGKLILNDTLAPGILPWSSRSPSAFTPWTGAGSLLPTRLWCLAAG
jgi:hypothetical protein